MALSALIEWDVRTTNGAADNGGGFKAGASGTDRSQQNGAQVVIDNVTITCTTPGAGSNTLTFTAGYTPTAADVGNVVAITGGTNINANLYEITGFTGTTWTLTGSTNLTTGGGAGSAITGNMGGARSGLTNGTTPLINSTTGNANVVGGNTIWIKNEAGWNEFIKCNTTFTNSFLVIAGYNSAHGDNPTGSNRPVNDRGAASGDVFQFGSAGTALKHLVAKAAGGTGNGFSLNGTRQVVINCRATANANRGFFASNANSHPVFLLCEADNNTNVGFEEASAPHAIYVACVSRSNSGGFNVSGAAIECLCFAGSGTAFALADATTALLVRCTADGAATGVNATATQGAIAAILACILSNNTTGALGGASQVFPSLIDYNDFFGNGTARSNFPTGAHDLALDPQYVDSANGDFGVGANLSGTGWPVAFPETTSSTSTSHPDTGAVQRAAGTESPEGQSMFVG